MSMIKVIQPHAQDFSEPVAALIKISSRGLIGADKQDFVKRAGAEFAEKALHIKLAKDEVPVHLIAIGATEDYGPNRNGDGFTRECCEKYHPTFEKFARFYRDHCFPAGTAVVMADRTRKPIEQVRLGDMVATLDGPKPVTQLMRNEYDGPGMRLKLSGVHTELVATAAHPVLVLRRKQLHCCHKYNRLGKTAHGLLCREFRAGLAAVVPTYVPVDEICANDYVLIPKPRCGSRLVEPAFARLIGWVGSEGCLGANGSIQFTFATKNTADIVSVTECLRQNGCHVGLTVRDDGLTQLSSCSKQLVAELSRYVCGKLSQKRLTAATLQLSRESLLELMSAYIEGDGHVSRKPPHRGQLRIRSSSPQMLASLTDIIRALDLPVTVQWDIPSGQMVSPTNGAVYNHAGSGTATVNAHYADVLAVKTRKRHAHKSARAAEILTLNGCQLVRVLAATPITISEPVYNLEVAGPHHYIANEVVVHNCNKNPAKSFGIVKASHYNEPMRRIELICALNGSKEAAERNGGLIADKEIEKLANDKDIAVSMACKIPFDKCSSCGNSAKTRAEYCDSIEHGGHCKAGGLKHNIGRVMEDGHVLHADNPNPSFFDISHVFRPADRIAYVSGKLEKAAGVGVLSGAELAEQLGVTAPIGFDTDGQASKRASLQLEVLTQLVQAEKLASADAAGWAQVALSAAPAVQPPIDMNTCPSVKIASVFRGLADAGVILPLRDFLQLTVKASSDQLVGAVANALPNIFSKIANSQEVVLLLENNVYLPAENAPPIVRVWAEKVALTHSVLPTSVEKRAYLAAIRNVQSVDFPCEKQASGNAEIALAQHYALYKIAACALVCEKYGNTWLTTNHCVLQNYIT
ncbi:hypothetical protein [Sphingorhabdus sp.]|uniref:hypothetical protein n=1 Tax=Sphingorhabdus sp. TaxID=1902408 RepID=UPI00333F7411